MAELVVTCYTEVDNSNQLNQLTLFESYNQFILKYENSSYSHSGKHC